MNVQSILGRKGTDVAVVQTQDSLEHVVGRLAELGVGALVVSDDGSSIAGIISERDVVRSVAAHGTDALQQPVSSAMSTEVVTCTAGDGVDALMQMMTDRRIRHLPVVDDADALAGIISIGDVVKARLAELEQENSALASYVSGY